MIIEHAGGYADLNPWPELGDPTLEECLKGGPLLRRAQELATIDGDARRKGISLLEGLTFPKSHYLWNGKLPPPGYTHIKVKGYYPELLELPYIFRFDFNNRLTHEEFKHFLEITESYWDKIDFIEDPYPYDETWKTSPVPLAADRNPPVTDIVIWKPEREKIKPAKRLIVTSNLGHPLGEAAAAWYAAHHTTEVCGINSLSNSAPDYQPISGLGFGNYD